MTHETHDTSEPAALSEAQLAAIASRLAGITPGPWEVGENAFPFSGQVYGADGVIIASIDDVWREESPTNRVFVAHAPTDVVTLLADDRRLRTVVARQTQQMVAMRAIVEAVAIYSGELNPARGWECYWCDDYLGSAIPVSGEFDHDHSFGCPIGQARALLATLADGQMTMEGAGQ